MKWVWATLAIAIFSTVAIGQQFKLEGRLITDEGKPVPKVRVRIADEESPPTSKDGKFNIRLPAKAKAGERVFIIVNDPIWIINQPLDGEWAIPAIDQKNLQPLDVVVALRGSNTV